MRNGIRLSVLDWELDFESYFDSEKKLYNNKQQELLNWQLYINERIRTARTAITVWPTPIATRVREFRCRYSLT